MYNLFVQKIFLFFPQVTIPQVQHCSAPSTAKSNRIWVLSVYPQQQQQLILHQLLQ